MSFNYITKIWSSGNIEGNYYSWTESGSAKEDFNGEDIGITSSLGFEIPILDRVWFVTELNYGIGLNNIADGSIGSYAEKINSRNFNITAGIVYKINDFNLTDYLKKL